MKEFIKRTTPEPVRALIRRYKRTRLRREFAALPLAAAFSKTYRDRMWGGGADAFVSGDGSFGVPAAAYVEYVCRFIRDRDIESVVDLGCGDFRIGRALAATTRRYVGVDVVPELVAYNAVHHGTPGIEFRCLDITRDELPPGELCLVRQVLQHLSNAEIARVLRKVGRYRYALITEHYPAPGPGFVANRDKPHGPDTRIPDGSAVVLAEPPFSLSGVLEVLTVSLDEDATGSGETIRTFLCAGPDSAAAAAAMR